jgi:hypothetical protein
MENKYFTPEISDLYIGYECEKNCNIIGAHSTEVEQVWLSYTIHYDRDFTNIESDIVDYRVPYLTKEQIEAEGWKETSKYKYEKIDSNITSYYGADHYLWIMHPATTVSGERYLANSFKGHCKDINTFRKIIKLLGI